MSRNPLATNPQVAQALARSRLAGLSSDLRDRLLAGAERVHWPAGTVVYRPGEHESVGVVLAGLLRVFLVAPDGREVTVRYNRRGNIVGIAFAVLDDLGDLHAQVVTPFDWLRFDLATVQTLVPTEAELTWALLQELVHYQQDLMRAFAGVVFGTVRQRVNRHLLDLVSTLHPAPPFVVGITQQELADAVGTTREVVARALRELRHEDLVATTRHGIVLLDPDGLAAETGTDGVPGAGARNKSH